MDDYICRKTVTAGLDYIINELNKLITDDSPNDGYTDIKKQVEEIKRGVLNIQPAQPELIRCKDCKWWGYDDDDGAVRVCHAAKHVHMSSNWSIMIYRTHKGDFYCADAERCTDAD